MINGLLIFFLKRNGTSDLYGEGPFMVIALNQSAELFKDKTTVHFAIICKQKIFNNNVTLTIFF